ncbi:bifunctional apoptosis regulator isoform X2 [Mustela lutreola]|uniref:Bifunctional apoptosis regulator isoform X3 n=1 Tax=Mustela putorius furo TaxID=9669 RepID=A0A8U0RN23_MUSPF|nr:bifunctional apoptosis regulator isoform X3 [Mustela erminea]XP_044927950.1 bifunctional apoptosis regulator isoform X3 [Mustela putorius furo]XP_059010647.1 bifunctional apoptosis regulator isoform X2 [Mustela lutreola]
MEELPHNDLNTMTHENGDPLQSTSPQISVSEFSCHCCYDILVNPTTLNCGHSFCRHCLALWWASSKKTECPECREKWEGFPKVNILLRLLLTLTEEEFSRPPYTIENSSHRRAILLELERVKALGVKPPQNLWEYKAVNPGRSLFLLYALKSSPRLGLLYLYLFDYTDTFLPFIHTICPLQEDSSGEDIITRLLDLREPTWKQWREFLVKYSFLPYQLIAEFAWDWLEVHYWTSRFLIVNAMLLSVLEFFSFWRIWSRSELKTVPQRMWNHFWKVSTQGLFVAMFWPLIPQFVCNCLFYWALYFNPIINIDLVVKEVRRLETQVL